MQIIPADRKTFEVIRNKLVQATIHFPSTWKQDAEIQFRDGAQLNIKVKNSWKGQYQAVWNDQHRADIKFNWRGFATVERYESPGASPTEYLIKKESIWRNDYSIERQDGSKILKVNAKWSWRKFNFSYTVDELDLTEEAFNLEMIAYVIFIHRIHMQQASAA